MECFPPCVTCTGLCKKTPPPHVQKTRKAPEATKRYERREGYIVLICGAYTTLEEQRTTPGYRKSRRRYWCEKHQHWANPYTFAERIANNDVKPLF